MFNYENKLIALRECDGIASSSCEFILIQLYSHYYYHFISVQLYSRDLDFYFLTVFNNAKLHIFHSLFTALNVLLF